MIITTHINIILEVIIMVIIVLLALIIIAISSIAITIVSLLSLLLILLWLFAVREGKAIQRPSETEKVMTGTKKHAEAENH